MSNPSIPAGVADMFVTPQGASVSIFFQSTEMGQGVRQRLLKVLKRGSAALSSDPKIADIVVVRQDTDTGRGLIRTWGGDQVVLHYPWIDACVRAGRMLGEADGWGGFIAQDDGMSIGDFEVGGPADDSDHAQPDPEQHDGPGLPTPRQTKSPPSPPCSTSQVPGTSLANGTLNLSPVSGDRILQPQRKDIDPFHFLQAISDELLNNSDGLLRENGRRLQAVIPNLFDGSPEDVEMAPPDTPFMSEKARGKRKDSLHSIASRMSSASIPPVTPTKSSAWTPDPSGSLFMVNKRPLKFYVQPDTYQRKDLVKSIRKNGGVLVSHVQEADYAILYAKAVTAASRKDYQSSLASATADKIPAVKGQFVEDCIARNKLLDYKPYVFVPPTKGKRPTSMQSTESSSSEDDEPLSQKAKQAQSEKPSSKPAKLSKASSSKASISTPQVKRVAAGSSSPAVPKQRPSSTVLAKPAPKKERVFFRYTEAELELALELAYKYWEEDYRQSDTQLAKLLHNRMSHHTLSSWQTYLNQTKKKEFEEVKKKASIKCRKRMDQEKAEQERLSRASSLAAESQGDTSRRSSVPSIEQISPPPPPNAPLSTTTPRTTEQDIETFADFLAFKGGDQFDPNDPSSAYRALSAMSPWRSSEGWGTFWTAEWQRIQPLYQKKLDEAEALEQGKREDTFNEGEIGLGDQVRDY